MNQSPALSPRPNPPGPGFTPSHPKAKALAILNNASTNSPAPTATTTTTASSPGDGGEDQADKLNQEVRNQFVIGKEVGSGTYAKVFVSSYRSNPASLVAIKRINLNPEYKDGMALDAVREIKFLSEIDHPNILKLLAVYSTKGQQISLVLEYLPRGDLEKLWQAPEVTYTGRDIKAWMLMTMRGLWFCHENRILHRDIKSNNLLIAADGTVKLGDFGLARSMADPGRPMTTQVITQYYRPPELFFGARHYGGKVDVWSVGCVMAELAIRAFLFFGGDTEISMISMMTDLCGSVSEDNWPGVSQLKNYFSLTSANKKPQPMSYWRNRFSMLGEDGVDLLRKMLAMDPRKRWNAKEVLEHPYWTNAPKPSRLEDLPDLPKKDEGKVVGEQLKRPAGNLDHPRGEKVARKLDFGAMRG